MSDINVDDFYRDSALILLRLYAFFPRPETLFVEDISGPDQTDEFGMHSKRHLACFATMLWLADEGYVRFAGPIKQEALDQAVLTSRALLILNRPPLGFDPAAQTEEQESASLRAQRHTNLYRLREAVKGKDSVRIRQAVLDLLQQAHSHCT